MVILMVSREIFAIGDTKLFYVDVTPPEYKAPFIYAYIIDPGGNGPLVLIETGPISQVDKLVNVLEELGARSRGLEVFVTHIHLDHAGAAGIIGREFHARIHVHPLGAKHLVNPSKLWASSREVLADMAEVYGEPKPLDETLVSPTVDRESSVFGKVIVTIYHTPGHASHHQSILVKVGEARILFPGDSAGVRLATLDAVIPTTPPPLRLELYKESLRLQMDLKPSHVAYTHASLTNPETLERHWRQVLLWEDTVSMMYKKRATLDEVLKKLYDVDVETRRFIDAYNSLSPYLIKSLERSVDGFIKYFEWAEELRAKP